MGFSFSLHWLVVQLAAASRSCAGDSGSQAYSYNRALLPAEHTATTLLTESPPGPLCSSDPEFGLGASSLDSDLAPGMVKPVAALSHSSIPSSMGMCLSLRRLPCPHSQGWHCRAVASVPSLHRQGGLLRSPSPGQLIIAGQKVYVLLTRCLCHRSWNK